MDYWATMKHNLETMTAKTILDSIQTQQRGFAEEEAKLRRDCGNAQMVGETLKRYNAAKRKRLEMERIQCVVMAIVKGEV